MTDDQIWEIAVRFPASYEEWQIDLMAFAHALLKEAASAPQAEPATDEPGLLEYVLQDDLHNRTTPRVIDIAYTAFMAAKQPNAEDGGPSDWFTDTRPVVLAAIEKLRKDLLAASPADQVEDARDAARYRWLRDSDRLGDDELDGQIVTGSAGAEDLLWGQRMDNAIDAAMSATPPAAKGE